jgi:Tfp pilus assembly protein FimT
MATCYDGIMRHSNHDSEAGFTVLELVVIIATVTILVTLLFLV